MSSGRPLVVPAGSGTVLSVLGDSTRLLVDSESSGGTLLQFESISPPGGGPPMHCRANDDETFLILEGNVKFSIQGRESVDGPGSFVFAPRGKEHTFMNPGPGPARMIITCTPSGLEKAFREIAATQRPASSPPKSSAPRSPKSASPSTAHPSNPDAAPSASPKIKRAPPGGALFHSFRMPSRLTSTKPDQSQTDT